jgi:thiol-disulfide isomerase/thioredoxin
MRLAWLAPFAALAVLPTALTTTLATDALGDQGSSARPWLGVTMAPGTDGVQVKHVVRGSPADKAGIHEGDKIIKVDGSLVAAPADVTTAFAQHAVGDVVPVVVTRSQSEKKTKVTVAAFPTVDEMMRMDFVGAFAPSWKGVTRLRGKVPADVSVLRGRVVIVDFWATWCGPCRYVAPVLTALQTKYGAQGLSIVGITTETEDSVGDFVDRMGMTYGIGVDAKGQTSIAYSANSLPTLFVIDKRGVVREVEIGYASGRDALLDVLVKTLLAEPAPTD